MDLKLKIKLKLVENMNVTIPSWVRVSQNVLIGYLVVNIGQIALNF